MWSITEPEFLSSVLSIMLSQEEMVLEEKLDGISQTHRIIRQIGEEELPDGSLAMRYRFAHALYQNVLDQELASKRRILLHRQTAELLLQHYGAQSARIAVKLAVHFKNGRDYGRAFEYFTMAGDNARKLFANMEAASLYRNAIEQWSELVKKEPDQKVAISELYEKLGDALSQSGYQKDAREAYQNASSRLEGGPPWPHTNLLIEGRLHRKMAKTWETERKMEAAVKEYEASDRNLSERLESASQEWWQEWIQIQLDRSWLHYTRNQLSELESIAERVQDAIEKFGTPVQRSRFLQMRGLAAHRRHRYFINEEIIEYANDALKAARQSGDPHEIALTTFGLGFGKLYSGALDQACSELEEACRLSEKVGDAVVQSRSITYLTVAYRRMEELHKTQECIEKCFELCSNIKMEEYVAAAHANQSWLLLRKGNPEQARGHAEKAISIWTSLPVAFPFQGLALWPLLFLTKEEEPDTPLRYLRMLIDPAQQRLSDELTSLIQGACSVFS